MIFVVRDTFGLIFLYSANARFTKRRKPTQLFCTFFASDSEVMSFNWPPFTLRVFFLSGVQCHLSRLFCYTYLYCTDSKIFQIVSNLWKLPWHMALPHPSGNEGGNKFLVIIDMNKNQWQQRLVKKLAWGIQDNFHITCRIMLDLSTYGSASTANSIVSTVPMRLFLSSERT